MEEPSSPILRIKASPSHIRVAELLAEQVQKEYQEFLVRERAGTLTPRTTETCFTCKNQFIQSEMLMSERRRLCTGVHMESRYYCTEECQTKGELAIMRKAEEEDERRRLFKFRSLNGRWLISMLNSLSFDMRNAIVGKSPN
jgi:hypothetical protein